MLPNPFFQSEKYLSRRLLNFGIAHVMRAICPPGYQVVKFEDGWLVLTKDGRPASPAIDTRLLN